MRQLLEEALQQDEIEKYLDDRDIDRQVRAAAREIIEKHFDKEPEDRIKRGIAKTARAIRKNKIEVFVSYKHKYERSTKKIINVIGGQPGVKLDVWFDQDILIGDNWRDVLFDRIQQSHWFMLLLPGPADNWGWQLYEAGIFRAKMLPGDRLICLHHENLERAPQLEDYQSITSKHQDVTKFLHDILTKPGAVPGMDPLNPDLTDVEDVAEEIVEVFQEVSGVSTEHYGYFVEMGAIDPSALNHPSDLEGIQIIQAQGEQAIFARQRGKNTTWGELISNLDLARGTEWLSELIAALRAAANGNIVPTIEATFPGANGAEGKEFRPVVLSSQRRNGAMESFHIGFVEVLGQGKSSRDPRELRVLQTALRLSYRCRWELIETYGQESVLNDAKIEACQNILERLEREAYYHGLLDPDLLSEQFEGEEALVISRMYEEWRQLRSPDQSGTLDQAFASKDGKLLQKSLKAFTDLNRRFMIIGTKRFAELVARKW
ncbi:MAG: TIR domain-containing protein [Hyphomicrobiales bacterium]|nr:TIR domain-containing protein [Hyphomicrobiales bacterium]